MRKNVIFALFALFFVTVATAQETTEAATPAPVQEESALSFDFEQAIYSKYVWRGVTFNDDPVNQGSATVSYEGFSFNVWYNTDLSDENDQKNNVTEVDYTLSYSGNINETIAYDAGVIYYDFPAASNSGTAEAFLGLSFDTFLSPSVTVYYDFVEVDGFYVDIAAGHALELTDNLALELGANLGIMDDEQSEVYVDGQGTNVSNITLSAALPFALNDTFTITPAVYFNSRVTGNNDGSSADDESVFTSISVSASF